MQVLQSYFTKGLTELRKMGVEGLKFVFCFDHLYDTQNIY